MELTKDILVQYCEIKEEIRDLRERIDRDEQRLQRIKEEGVSMKSSSERQRKKEFTICIS